MPCTDLNGINALPAGGPRGQQQRRIDTVTLNASNSSLLQALDLPGILVPTSACPRPAAILQPALQAQPPWAGVPSQGFYPTRIVVDCRFGSRRRPPEPVRDTMLRMLRTRLAAREAQLSVRMNEIKYAEPARVGLAHLESHADDSLEALLNYCEAARVDPEWFYHAVEPIEFRLEPPMLTFASAHNAGSTANDTVRAHFYESRNRFAAVVLLPYWNAERASLQPFARALARLGIACLLISLPYHDERRTAGVGFARELACENLGLTIQANRQAVADVRAALSWLDRRGYRSLGLVGLSIGSSVASIVAALDERVRATALLLMADDFADVVLSGTATRAVAESLRRHFTSDEIRAAWSLISPSTYADRIVRRCQPVLIISGDLDRVFVPEQTERYVRRLGGPDGPTVRWIRYPCGHYTLGTAPFSYQTLFHTTLFLRRHLLRFAV